VESSTAWFKKHAEVKMVSRDRGKIFREAASRGAPQAKQLVDRFHLQKNFAEASIERWNMNSLPPGTEDAGRSSGIAELVDFVEGLADDAEAVVNGCTESWSNGMVEGFVNKVKWIKRSSYGQAGFPLLQRRVLLRPASRAIHHEDETQAA
jgi:transposase